MKRIISAAMVSLSAFLFVSCGDDESDEYHGVKRAEAKDACHSRIESFLVSPGTADFEGFTETQYTPSERGVFVDGHVDSENALGGTIRTVYQCEVWNEGEDLMVSITKSEESGG